MLTTSLMTKGYLIPGTMRQHIGVQPELLRASMPDVWQHDRTKMPAPKHGITELQYSYTCSFISVVLDNAQYRGHNPRAVCPGRF
jgi:hypothetical protein